MCLIKAYTAPYCGDINKIRKEEPQEQKEGLGLVGLGLMFQPSLNDFLIVGSDHQYN